MITSPITNEYIQTYMSANPNANPLYVLETDCCHVSTGIGGWPSVTATKERICILPPEHTWLLDIQEMGMCWDFNIFHYVNTAAGESITDLQVRDNPHRFYINHHHTSPNTLYTVLPILLFNRVEVLSAHNPADIIIMSRTSTYKLPPLLDMSDSPW